MGQDLTHAVDPAAAIAQLDIGQHQPGRLGCHHGHGFPVGGRYAHDAVAKIGDDGFDIHCDDGLVLDDQYARPGLPGDFGQRILDQGVHGVHVTLDQIPHGCFGKPFHRGQQQGLPCRGHDGRQACAGHRGWTSIRCRHAVGTARLCLRRGHPHALKGLEQGQPGRHAVWQQCPVSHDGFQCCGDQRIAMLLRSGQRAGMAPQKRQMGCKRGRQ